MSAIQKHVVSTGTYLSCHIDGKAYMRIKIRQVNPLLKTNHLNGEHFWLEMTEEKYLVVDDKDIFATLDCAYEEFIQKATEDKTRIQSLLLAAGMVP